MAPSVLRPFASELCRSSSRPTRRLVAGRWLKDAKPPLDNAGSHQWHNTLGASARRALVPYVAKSLVQVRHASVVVTPPPPSSAGRTYSTVVVPPTKPFSELVVGVPTEVFEGERRVALTPTNVALLLKKGFSKVLVQRGAGAQADFLDDAYKAAGATLVEGPSDVWSGADIVLKVRSPSKDELPLVREKQTIISFLQPAQNKELVDAIAARGATSFAMDMIPRISRAQVFDALSSMANIAGYKAVLEASNNFGRFLTGQVTAAGKIPPCKVLVIGAGVAGLSAIATARRLGAIVRGFDTRPAAREQVQSLGAEFIEVEIEEDGSGAGGYAKEMSKEFIEAEMKLFYEQAKDVDIIITTALIPGKPAPKLIKKYMLEVMKPGSVVVDLAAEAGGNCEATEKGKLVVYKDVKVIGKEKHTHCNSAET
jgi:NAD(P) transhydrogenase